MTDRILQQTTSLCPVCKAQIPSQIVAKEDAVYLQKDCAKHGSFEVQIEASFDWYEQTMRSSSELRPPTHANPAVHGCPFDCGPCNSHEQSVLLPIVPITSACSLDCPICYTHNRNEQAYRMSADELDAILDHILREDPQGRILNLTGGEPTEHPDFERLVQRCVERGIERITVSTHGLRFLKHPELVERMARLGARVILSFDSFSDDVNQSMLGGTFTEGKMRVLQLLEKHDVPTTLLPVVAKGINTAELGRLVSLTLEKHFIRSLELHTMTFTGQNGAGFEARARITPSEVLSLIEAQTDGRIRRTDFMPSPAAHPLCYQVTYLLRLNAEEWLPLLRFLTRDLLRELLAGGLYLQPSPELESTLSDIINRLWAGELGQDLPDVTQEQVVTALRALVSAAFDETKTQRQRLEAAESRLKAIYVHNHMDEMTFDTARIRQCCVGIREPSGQNIPSCAYNVVYRERDARFSEKGDSLVSLRRRSSPKKDSPQH